MSIERLQKLKERLLRLQNNTVKIDANEEIEAKKSLINALEAIKENLKNKEESPYLDKKVDAFIDWYFKEFIKGNRTDIGEYYGSRDMRNLIEKIAVWYELKYPDYVINEMIPGSAIEENHMTDEMKNTYSTDNFMNHLPIDEGWWFINKYPYSDGISVRAFYYDSPKWEKVYLYLDKSTGTILKSEGLNAYTDGKISDELAVGLSLNELYNLFKSNHIDDEKGPDKFRENLSKRIKEELDYVEKYRLFQERLKDAVMYRIIERGRCRFGSRRGFLFAKEFHRDIDIPMKYIDMSDPGLILFIDEYLKAGGNPNLICYKNYDVRTSDNTKIDTISLKDVIKSIDKRGCYPEMEEKYRQK